MLLSIVIPIYNERDMLPILYERLNEELVGIRQILGITDSGEQSPALEILFVNDGSTDDSLPIMESIVKTNRDYRYINLSRNFGHQAAVSAGLQAARGQAVVIMDGDLQDPPELIADMLKKWKEGFDVVYAVRRKREGGFFKKIAYKTYYRMKSLMADDPVQKDSGDFSLLDRKVVEVVNRLPEKNRYLRGLRAWVGFKQTGLEYDRPIRKSGISKYSITGLFKLAFQGITSTSVKPLFISGLFGLFSIFIVVGIIGFVLFSKAYIPSNQMPPGWASLMITVAFFSGCQLASIWLLSLYMAKLYKETLSRPTYIVEYDSLTEQRNITGDENECIRTQR